MSDFLRFLFRLETKPKPSTFSRPSFRHPGQSSQKPSCHYTSTHVHRSHVHRSQHQQLHQIQQTRQQTISSGLQPLPRPPPPALQHVSPSRAVVVAPHVPRPGQHAPTLKVRSFPYGTLVQPPVRSNIRSVLLTSVVAAYGIL